MMHGGTQESNAKAEEMRKRDIPSSVMYLRYLYVVTFSWNLSEKVEKALGSSGITQDQDGWPEQLPVQGQIYKLETCNVPFV